MKTTITGDDLKNIGFPQGRAIGNAIQLMEKYFSNHTKEDVLKLLADVLAQPAHYLDHAQLAGVAKELVEKPKPEGYVPEIALKEKGDAYAIFGAGHIEQGALDQMNIAMKLPVTVAGALMPDAHQGYGLPIGGVLAANNAVIPYGVGVDIGCRMCLSIYDITENAFLDNQSKFKRELIAHSKFGAGQEWKKNEQVNHEVLDRSEFNTNPFIKKLQDKAVAQLGTSGGGNHFVEWGIIEMLNDDKELNIPKGKYLALLTHSGSRGFGATIAGHYTQLAKEICKLPDAAKNLAYLDLNSAEGQEYWLAMNLAGDYASACHQVIHDKLTKAIGGTLLARVENHHNFAWKEKFNGQDVIVHRKGATPAAKGVMGIIPGSMTAPGFLVRGKGETTSVNSASHGAGRQMSRTAAIKNISKGDMQKILNDHGVTLIGAGLDEAPMAYKDIHTVMAAQTELVDVLAKFTPKMVRMADDGSKED
ncbi:MAG TPA: RtcB family protein [Flavobacteriales bacterium]|nr:RtcB family protein [Flavobacteriales bacterium]